MKRLAAAALLLFPATASAQKPAGRTFCEAEPGVCAFLSSLDTAAIGKDDRKKAEYLASEHLACLALAGSPGGVLPGTAPWTRIKEEARLRGELFSFIKASLEGAREKAMGHCAKVFRGGFDPGECSVLFDAYRDYYTPVCSNLKAPFLDLDLVYLEHMCRITLYPDEKTCAALRDPADAGKCGGTLKLILGLGGDGVSCSGSPLCAAAKGASGACGGFLKELKAMMPARGGEKMKYAYLLVSAIMSFRVNASAAPFLRELASAGDFSSVSAPSFLGTSMDLPMTLVLLDRSEPGIYYINPSSYPLHMDFINTHLLSLDKGLLFIDNTDGDARRFVTAFLVKRDECYTLELWLDDSPRPELLSELFRAVKNSFPGRCLKFNPLSPAQLELRPAGVPYFRNSLETAAPRYQLISEGTAYGKLRIGGGKGKAQEKGAVYVLREPPGFLSQDVSGFVSEEVYTSFSHACILARTLKIPAFYLPGASSRFRELEGRDVRFEAWRSSFSVTRATPGETAGYLAKRRSLKKRPLFADLEWDKLTDLSEQTSADVPRFGAKSSNLGQVLRFRIPGIEVPAGFTVPFGYYARFIRENGLGDAIAALLDDPAVYSDAAVRAKRLAGLRRRIEGGRLPEALAAAVRAKLSAGYQGKGVFVRSSTNSEDLPGFSGAGLYTTVPNVRGEEKVLEAVRQVWASIWNDRAFDARELAGIDHRTAMPAVLIQEAMDSEGSGVMFTRSDLPGANAGCLEIGAKRGLGIRVVEGHAAPERLFYCGGELRYAGSSRDDRMLSFAPGGGVVESTAPAGTVLAPALARRLAEAGLEIQKRFRGVPQDIEWLVIGDKIYIVQSRPYVFSGRAGD